MLSDNGHLVFTTGDNKEIRFQTSASGRVKVGNEDLTLLLSQVSFDLVRDLMETQWHRRRSLKLCDLQKRPYRYKFCDGFAFVPDFVTESTNYKSGVAKHCFHPLVSQKDHKKHVNAIKRLMHNKVKWCYSRFPLIRHNSPIQINQAATNCRN